MSYQYTHITWRRRNEDGHVSTYVNTIPDKERAADEIKELALIEGVFALRFIHYGEEEITASQSAPVEFHTRIGPPITD